MSDTLDRFKRKRKKRDFLFCQKILAWHEMNKSGKFNKNQTFLTAALIIEKKRKEFG